MIRFEDYPQWLEFGLWMVPVLILLLFWWAAFKRKRQFRMAGDPQLLEQLSNSISRKRRLIKSLLQALGLIFILFALLGPKFSDELTEVQRQGVDIVVLLDVSNSMRAQDIVPDRLEKARFELRRLVESLRGDRIGLVVFAGQAHLQTPLTLDYAAFEMFLDISDESLIGVQGTAMADALEVGLQAFDTEDKQHRAMILISDGEDHEGALEPVLDELVQNNVIVHTAGIGSFSGTPIPILDDQGNVKGYHKTKTGEVVTTRLYTETLETISAATGGRFIHLNSASAGLDQIYEDILKMEQKDFKRHEYTNFKEQYHWFALVGLLLLVIEALLSDINPIARNWQGDYVHD